MESFCKECLLKLCVKGLNEFSGIIDFHYYEQAKGAEVSKQSKLWP